MSRRNRRRRPRVEPPITAPPESGGQLPAELEDLGGYDWDNHQALADREAAGLVEILWRRVGRRWHYDLDVADTFEQRLVIGGLAPLDPHDVDAWRPLVRLRRAEGVFLQIMGLWALRESYPESHQRYRWAVDCRNKIMRQGVLPLTPETRAWLIRCGIWWLGRLREITEQSEVPKWEG